MKKLLLYLLLFFSLSTLLGVEVKVTASFNGTGEKWSIEDKGGGQCSEVRSEGKSSSRTLTFDLPFDESETISLSVKSTPAGQFNFVVGSGKIRRGGAFVWLKLESLKIDGKEQLKAPQNFSYVSPYKTNVKSANKPIKVELKLQQLSKEEQDKLSEEFRTKKQNAKWNKKNPKNKTKKKK